MLKSKLFAGVFLLLLSVSSAFGQSQMETDSIQWNNWSFRLSPYIWAIGFEGELYRPPQPGNFPEPTPPKYEIDVGFRDIRNSIKFIMMLGGQYRGERWVAQFNSSALIIESEAITPLDLLLQDNVVRLTYFGGDLEAGYRVLKNPKFEIDALLGLKFIYFGVDLASAVGGDVDVEGARDKGWIDPVLGANFRYNPIRKFSLVGYADLGIPVFGTDRSFQFIGMAQYHFTKTFYTSIGYRHYDIQIPEDEAIFNGSLKGFILHLGFQF